VGERESALPFEEPIEFVCALTAFSCQLALVEVRRHFFPLIKNNDKNCILQKKKKTLLFFMLPFFCDQTYPQAQTHATKLKTC
jgi:hypothetical protein